MRHLSLVTILASAVLFLASPLSALAFTDFGGWVINVPGVPGSIMSAGALPTFPPPGVFSFWYPAPGVGCLNGVQEVNIRSAEGPPTPPVLLQFPVRTFDAGPAQFPQQALLGKILQGMPCIANFVSWFYCGFSLCPLVTPLPYFIAPLIIFNGSSQGPAF